MKEAHLKYLKSITGLSVELQRTYVDSMAYWGSDAPPTVIFGDIGARIVEIFRGLDRDQMDEIVSAIESGMTSSDVELKTLVATGLIEGMAGQAWEHPETWSETERVLGPMSRNHAAAWVRARS